MTNTRSLERWKQEALVVIGEWELVWEALGSPGTLGESRAAASLSEVERLRRLAGRLDAEAELARTSPDGRHPELRVMTHAAALRYAARIVRGEA